MKKLMLRGIVVGSFEVRSKEELNSLIEKIRQIESVKDIERTAG